MKIAAFFAGVGSAIAKGAEVVLADVLGVFTKASTAIDAAPLPANIKADLKQTLVDSSNAVQGAAALAGGLAGAAVADGVNDLTSLFYKTAGAISGAKSLEDFSVAEKAVLAQAWQTIRAQGDTLLAQAMAGVDPVAQQAANAKQAQQSQPQPS